jgi:hypothetical protein
MHGILVDLTYKSQLSMYMLPCSSSPPSSRYNWRENGWRFELYNQQVEFWYPFQLFRNSQFWSARLLSTHPPRQVCRQTCIHQGRGHKSCSWAVHWCSWRQEWSKRECLSFKIASYTRIFFAYTFRPQFCLLPLWKYVSGSCLSQRSVRRVLPVEPTWVSVFR